jgi:hypothetical protein
MRYQRIILQRGVIGWRAYPDTGNGPDTPHGWGANEVEAIEDLLDRLVFNTTQSISTNQDTDND